MMSTLSRNSFIQVTEVWVPSQDGTRLEWRSGIYGELASFREESVGESFLIDEGLPGKAWASGQPVILKEFTEANFKRTKIAHESGLTCGIAIPVFLGEFVKGVVVFLCGEVGGSLGAIEVWRTKEGYPPEIAMADGYYGSLEDFAFLASKTHYARGFGLPGMVWEQNMPVIVDNLRATGPFSRALDLDGAQITTALGIPCDCERNRATVVCLLSSVETPIALRYEVWTPDADRQSLVLHAAACNLDFTYREQVGACRIERGAGAIGQTWVTGSPQTCADLAADPTVAARSAETVGLQHMVTFPTLENGRLKAILAWYF